MTVCLRLLARIAHARGWKAAVLADGKRIGWDVGPLRAVCRAKGSVWYYGTDPRGDYVPASSEAAALLRALVSPRYLTLARAERRRKESVDAQLHR